MVELRAVTVCYAVSSSARFLEEKTERKKGGECDSLGRPRRYFD